MTDGVDEATGIAVASGWIAGGDPDDIAVIADVEIAVHEGLAVISSALASDKFEVDRRRAIEHLDSHLSRR